MTTTTTTIDIDNNIDNNHHHHHHHDQDNSVIRIVLVGFGEIASKAHWPAIYYNPRFELVAVVDPNIGGRKLVHEKLQTSLTQSSLSSSSKDHVISQEELEKIQYFTNLKDCLMEAAAAAANPPEFSVDAVAICTPPSVTLDLVEECWLLLENNNSIPPPHVLVEKPPGNNWRRLQPLKERAQKKYGVSLFTAYHTAACMGYSHAHEWLSKNVTKLESIHFTWKESVRKWHPGQVWVTQKQKDSNNNNNNNNTTTTTTVVGCEGVLDMVFNPISLLHALLLESSFSSLTLETAELIVPSNWETPIAGSVQMKATTKTHDSVVVPVTGEFAWNYEPSGEDNDQDEIWSIQWNAIRDHRNDDNHDTTTTLTTPTTTIPTVMILTDGGCQVSIDNQLVTTQPTPTYPLTMEYVNLYQQFASLIDNKQSFVDDDTPRLLEEIQTKATYHHVPEPYSI